MLPDLEWLSAEEGVFFERITPEAAPMVRDRWSDMVATINHWHAMDVHPAFSQG
jgi:hypothetical protein